MEGNTEQLQLTLAVASSEPGRARSTVSPSHSSVRVRTWLPSFATCCATCGGLFHSLCLLTGVL